MPFPFERLAMLDALSAAAALYDRVNLAADSNSARSRQSGVAANRDTDRACSAHDLSSITGHPGVIALYKVIAICRRRYSECKSPTSGSGLNPGRAVIKIANRRVLHRLKNIKPPAGFYKRAPSR